METAIAGRGRKWMKFAAVLFAILTLGGCAASGDSGACSGGQTAFLAVMDGILNAATAASNNPLQSLQGRVEQSQIESEPCFHGPAQ